MYNIQIFLSHLTEQSYVLVKDERKYWIGNLWMNSSADGELPSVLAHFLTNGVQNVKPYVLGGNFQHANCAPYATVKQIDAKITRYT